MHEGNCIDSIVPLKVDNFIIESSNDISIFYSFIIEIQLCLTLYSSIFLNSLQFLFRDWHHACSTISFFLLTHLAFDWLKVYIDFLFLFGLPSFLFLCTHVFFKLALNHLVCITYYLTQCFNVVWNFNLFLKWKFMLVWEFAFPSKKNPLYNSHSFFVCHHGEKISPPKKTTTSLQQVFPSEIVENKTIAIPNSPYHFGYSDNHNNEIWKHNWQ